MTVLRLVPPKGEAIVVDADEAVVGRESACTVVVPHPSVSRKHALIKRKQGVFFVVDQGSANGTYVDSKRVVDATLKEGNVLRFGSAYFRIEIREADPLESTAGVESAPAPTIMAPQSFAATVLEGDVLSEEAAAAPFAADVPIAETDPPRGRPDEPPPPSPEPQTVSRAAEPRPRPQKSPTPPQPIQPPPTPANRGPEFWVMIAAAALALLFVGAALGFAAAFMARRLGWL